MKYNRTTLLIGKSAVEKLRDSKVLLCGVGGVGSWAGEMLIRGGIGHLTMMDPDVVRYSNINRQLCALNSTLGQYKVNVLAERFRDIAPDADILALNISLQPIDCPALIECGMFDYVVDAIDERPAKMALISECVKQRVPIISSMGAANKLHPELVQVADISETFGCPLAKNVRKSLRKLGIESGVRVVFSPELPNEASIAETAEESNAKRPIGSISYMPAVFGMRCAAEVLQALINGKETSK